MSPIQDTRKFTSQSKTQAHGEGKLTTTAETSLIEHLNRKILQTIVYLEDEYKGSVLVPAQNPNPKQARRLSLLTVKDSSSAEYTTHILFPLSTHPVLDRTPEDFVDTLDRSIEILGANFIVDDSEDAVSQQRAFLMEIRGLFRDRWDVLAAAQRHVDLLDQLVRGGFVELEEVLGGGKME
ncbi:hypothetical protein N7510_006340 [Penicillium lagena]|uniref:uncharacterized protein n=1 Tax=Penicillium lagena TaxID=94218 RepID=UPI0025415797|nr:uncharacterized protein N7510_006340 [Penicillium lagena]KAJ5613146.1 hypothetical protein N7510_006340 [Penicillium lagena]